MYNDEYIYKRIDPIPKEFSLWINTNTIYRYPKIICPYLHTPTQVGGEMS